MKPGEREATDNTYLTFEETVLYAYKVELEQRNNYTTLSVIQSKDIRSLVC